MSTITVTKPDGTSETVESNDLVVAHQVDSSGVYQGLVALSSSLTQVYREPPDEGYLWNFDEGRWHRPPDLAEYKLVALDRLDTAAGCQRLLFITSVPGQEATYIVKQEQAEAYIQDPLMIPPPYISAEAEAMGCDYLAAATFIRDTAVYWTDVVGPAIERERRRAKIAVEAATTISGVDSAVSAGLSALSAIVPSA